MLKELVCAAVAALLTVIGGAAAAAVMVLESNRADLPPGTELDAAAPLRLGAGERVTLVTSAGDLVERIGPYEGPAASGAEGDPGLIAALQGVMERSRTRSALGASRGERAAADGAVLDVVAGGDWCLGGGPPRLALPARGGDRLVVLAPERGAPVEFVWPGGAATAPWPEGARLESGLSYAVTVDEVRLGTFAIRAAPAVAGSPAARVAAYERAGCRAQAEAALAALGR